MPIIKTLEEISSGEKIMKMTGNTILITGAGSGIGLALAREFAELGNEVIVAVRSPEKLEIAARQGFKIEKADLSDAASIRNLASRVIENYPALNVVIHNAGISRTENYLEGVDESIQEEIVATNFLGPMRLTDALLPHLLKQESAVIMTVSSGLAFLPNAQAPTYSATKAAIHSYTQSLRYQLKETAVEVIELPPPYVQTSLSGDHQVNDPRAMPLAEFVSEVMQILKEHRQAPEILVNRVRELRFSADGGEENYQVLFERYNDQIRAAQLAAKP
jgi:uncharacterized oxidoreductase